MRESTNLFMRFLKLRLWFIFLGYFINIPIDCALFCTVCYVILSKMEVLWLWLLELNKKIFNIYFHIKRNHKI